jgi:tetratricopeptide (TPR) repeat protein
VACADVAVWHTPAKRAEISHTALAKQAEQNFWNTLHQGRYQDLPKAISLLTAAYLESPNDPHLAAHLGFAHTWMITERQRQKHISPTIVDEVILAEKYFSDAVALNPHDARLLGFLGDDRLIMGKIFKDQRQQTQAYFILKKAIRQWPQFNYFTAGYPMSILPINDKYFNEAIEWQWQTLDICAEHKIDRKNPSFAAFMKLATQQGPQRACWNSWIAPYNFEGFFLNMGDMLVKSGDWQTAIKIYNNAKLADNYSTWPYGQLLENRILHAKENIENFRRDSISTPDKTILFNSGDGCMVCHQQQR